MEMPVSILGFIGCSCDRYLTVRCRPVPTGLSLSLRVSSLPRHRQTHPVALGRSSGKKAQALDDCPHGVSVAQLEVPTAEDLVSAPLSSSCRQCGNKHDPREPPLNWVGVKDPQRQVVAYGWQGRSAMKQAVSQVVSLWQLEHLACRLTYLTGFQEQQAVTGVSEGSQSFLVPLGYPSGHG